MYQLTHEQFVKKIEDAIALFIEYNQQHGFEEELARIKAIHDLLDGMAGERDLLRHGELQVSEASHTLVA